MGLEDHIPDIVRNAPDSQYLIPAANAEQEIANAISAATSNRPSRIDGSINPQQVTYRGPVVGYENITVERAEVTRVDIWSNNGSRHVLTKLTSYFSRVQITEPYLK